MKIMAKTHTICMKKGWKVTILIFIGALVGFVSGFMGAGGGMLLVPALHFIAKEDTKTAHATAVAVILPVCFISSIVYIVKGYVQSAVFWPVLLGTLIGGVLGTVALKKLKSEYIALIFALLMIAAAVKMIFF